jgi:hypothetical protein
VSNDYDTTARNIMVDAVAAVGLRLALHTADPGGANSASSECTGGGYARAVVTWGAASGGVATATSTPHVISIASGQTVSFMSLWNAAATVRYWKRDVTDEAFGAAGTYTVTALTMDNNDV